MNTLAPRTRVLLGAAICALSIFALGAATAQAKLVKVTGSTVVAPSDAAKTFLQNNGVSVSPVGTTTAQDGNLTFPIFSGFGDTKSYNGILAHSGGLKFSKGDLSQVVRRPVAVRYAGKSVLLAQLPGRKGGCQNLKQAIHRFAVKNPGYVDPLRKAAKRYPKAAQQFVAATKRYCSQGRVIVLAKLRNLGKSVTGGQATLTADLKLSGEAAGIINRVAGSKVVRAGAPLGTATSTVTLAK